MVLVKTAVIIVIFSILPVQSAFGVIRVQTKHNVPFMYRNSNGRFVDGIEFHLIEAIAEQLNMGMKFEESSLDLDSTNIT